MKYQPNCSHGYSVTGSPTSNSTSRLPESNNSHHKKLIDVVKEVRNQQESESHHHSRSNGHHSKAATTLQFAALTFKAAKQRELHHNGCRTNAKSPSNTEVNLISHNLQLSLESHGH